MSTTPRLRRLAPAALAVSGLVLLSGAGGAVAGAMITGANVKDGSLTGRDIKDGSIGYADTSVSLDREHRKVGGYRVVKKSATVDPNGFLDGVPASCTGPTTILGMTAYWDGSSNSIQLEPQGPGTRRVKAYGQTSSSQEDTATIVLYCGRTSPN